METGPGPKPVAAKDVLTPEQGRVERLEKLEQVDRAKREKDMNRKPSLVGKIKGLVKKRKSGEEKEEGVVR